MPDDQKFALNIIVPADAFLKWLRELAPELAPDSQLCHLATTDGHTIKTVIRTDRQYTLSYLKTHPKTPT